jgi:two-component system sensor histidine kinase DesK
LGLSTVALKTDLVAALIDRDDDRARHELGELLRICVTARTDVRRIVEDGAPLTFDTELLLARDILTSSGVAVRLPDPTTRAPSQVDAVLATVVREAVTNILRHSRASQCSIALSTSDGVRLTISNDGVAPRTDDPVLPGGAGRGLANLGDRVTAAAGRFTTRRTETEFELSAEFPAAVCALTTLSS